MDKHFTKLDLIKYSIPAIAMTLALSLYTIISGYFISNYAGPVAFAAENLIFPLILIFSSVGLMVGTGSSAIIANKLGKNNKETASRYFSMFIYFCLIVAIIFTFIGLTLVRPVAEMLGATGELLDLSILYGNCVMCSLPGYILQMAFLVFFNTSGKPFMGFVTSIICGFSITVLDIVLVVVLGLGFIGAIIGVIATFYIGAIFPFVYFSRKNNSSYLHLVSPRQAFKNQNPSTLKLIIKASLNGSSETVQEIAVSLVALLCVFQINRYVGEDGIVAYGVIEYAWLVFNSLFLGLSVAVAPLMSYQQGAKNTVEMHSLFKNCMIITLGMSIISYAVSIIFAPNIVDIFVGYNPELAKSSTYIFRIYALTYLFCGIGIYGSSLFTSLGDGLVSALIAFLRTLVFEAIALIVFPMLFGSDGIWWASVFAEIVAAIMTIMFIITKGKKYGILKKAI